MNVSEGRDRFLLERLARACGPSLLDLHADPLHHRSVFTLAGQAGEVEAAVRSLTDRAFASLRLTDHDGVHPRRGVVDVVPFVPLAWSSGRLVAHALIGPAIEARERFGRWLQVNHHATVYYYGTLLDGIERTLPEIRAQSLAGLEPDLAPEEADPALGAVCVGARSFLVAYNLWLEGVSFESAKSIARCLRAPNLRTMAFDLGDDVQLSANLIEPNEVGPSQFAARVRPMVEALGGGIGRYELIGLVPSFVVEATPISHRDLLGLTPEATLEHALSKVSSARLAGSRR